MFCDNRNRAIEPHYVQHARGRPGCRAVNLVTFRIKAGCVADSRV